MKSGLKRYKYTPYVLEVFYKMHLLCIQVSLLTLLSFQVRLVTLAFFMFFKAFSQALVQLKMGCCGLRL